MVNPPGERVLEPFHSGQFRSPPLALCLQGSSAQGTGWPLAGERMVYLASALAQAVLETRVHLEVAGYPATVGGSRIRASR
jgi:hypothetical protein